MTVNIGSGISSQIVALQETTYGVAPTFTTPRTYEFKSETLALKKNTVQGQGLHAGGLYDRAGRRVLTTYEAAGDIVMDLPANQLGLLIQHMLGSFAATNTQIGTTGVFTQVHQPGTLLGKSLAFQKGVPATNGTVEPFTYVGCKVESWEISVEVNQIAQLKLTADARNELGGAGNSDPLNGSVPALATPVYTAGMQLFHFREGTVFTGGTPTLTSGVVSLVGETAAAQVKKCSVQHTAALDKARFFLGSNGFKAEQIENNFRKINGSFDIEWQSSEAMYNAFSADTTTSLELSFIGPIIGTSGTNHALLDIIIPNIKLDGEAPKVSGPAVVTQTVPWTGLDDEATTQIQVIYQTTDTTF